MSAFDTSIIFSVPDLVQRIDPAAPTAKNGAPTAPFDAPLGCNATASGCLLGKPPQLFH
jgi:hypothetical protein